MKYQVIQRFEDAITGETLEIGDSYTGDRAEHLLTDLPAPFNGPAIKAIEDEEEAEDVKPDVPTDKSTKAEIEEYLTGQGIDYDKASKKADLLALI
ncbi:MAG: hypothetical protein LBT37_04105 [Lactobacillaceae bacterium]|jgi:hypothetical protein|nr:hypothetical protein [Lactobacillaceae bacterium]